jgi:dethiobiotin synthase
MNGIFVIGTDTGVGKTAVCAGLLKMMHRQKSAAFWKPVQTGTIHGDDTAEVKALTQLDSSCFIEPAFRFPEPLSPYMAAKKWGKTIALEPMVETVRKNIQEDRFLIVEGAGGLLVPYDSHWMQIDLIKATGFPVLLVGKDKVGVINQALLTIEALKRAAIPLIGMILTSSTGTGANSKVIEEFGKISVLLELLPKEDKKLLMTEVERGVRLS